MDLVVMGTAVLYGAAAGGLRAVLGLWGKDPTQPIEARKALYTVILGVIVGAAVALTGWEASEVMLLIVNLGGTYALHKAVKGILKRIRENVPQDTLQALSGAIQRVRGDAALMEKLKDTDEGQALSAYLEGIESVLPAEKEPAVTATVDGVTYSTDKPKEAADDFEGMEEDG